MMTATQRMAEIFDEWLEAQRILGHLREGPHHRARATVCWFLTGYKTVFLPKEQEIRIIRPVLAAVRDINVKISIDGLTVHEDNARPIIPQPGGSHL